MLREHVFTWETPHTSDLPFRFKGATDAPWQPVAKELISNSEDVMLEKCSTGSFLSWNTINL